MIKLREATFVDKDGGIAKITRRTEPDSLRVDFFKVGGEERAARVYPFSPPMEEFCTKVAIEILRHLDSEFPQSKFEAIKSLAIVLTILVH